jgi:hypothetical protein
MFKIKVDGDVGVPISEKVSLNSALYREGISHMSYDGVNWIDLYDYESEYPDHIYNSQVACIKAFTILNPVNTTLTLKLENRNETNADLIATVLNQYGYPVSGNVNFKIENEVYTVRLNNGVAVLKIDLKDANITCEYVNLTGFSSSNKTVEIKSPLVATSINLTCLNVHNPVNITARILDNDGNPVKSGHVNFIVDNKIYPVEVKDGWASLNEIVVYPGIVDVSAYYSDMYYYDSSSANISFEITYINTRLELNVSRNECMNPVNVTAYVFDEYGNPVNGGQVTFTMSESLFFVDVINGTAKITHTFTRTGQNGIFAFYYDRYIYNLSSANTTVTVSKMNVTPQFSQIIDENNAIFGVSIKDCAKDYYVDFNINGAHKYFSSVDGNVLIELKDLDCGEYNYTITLYSAIYQANPISGSFNITYHKTKVNALTAIIYYGGQYSAQLFDENGSVIPDRDLFLTIDGKTYKGRTDSNGSAIFRVKSNSGTFTAAVNFIGDDEYVKSTASALIAVKSTIETSSGSVFAVNALYSATLRDSQGNVLAEKEVDVIVNYVSYKFRTDKNGVVSFNIKLDPGKYNIQITNPQTGEVKSQKIKVVDRITKNKDLKIYYGSSTRYKVRVSNDYGDYVEGLKVTFKINNKNYYAYTDGDGYAYLKIKEKPGKYKVTAAYNGCKVSNKIVVKSTLITKDIKVKKKKTIKFKAKLVNSKGKKLKNKKIIFKFKGKKYSAKTNKKGKAVLKIKNSYGRGKYKIVSKYGKLKIKNKITII